MTSYIEKVMNNVIRDAITRGTTTGDLPNRFDAMVRELEELREDAAGHEGICMDNAVLISLLKEALPFVGYSAPVDDIIAKIEAALPREETGQ